MRERLDQLLVRSGQMQTRARARDAILRGTVRVDGRIADKPAQKISADARIEIDDPAADYVSRAALKLKGALARFHVPIAERIALDLGASTGGFTQVLLEAGARRVHAIDVGHAQMHPHISADPRVCRRDGMNARELTRDDLDGDRPEVLVCDLSFISLRLALPPALELAADEADGVFLVKPQFEVGRARIGKGGIVTPVLAAACAREMATWLDNQANWEVRGLEPSPIAGGDGNSEWLLVARRAA